MSETPILNVDDAQEEKIIIARGNNQNNVPAFFSLVCLIFILVGFGGFAISSLISGEDFYLPIGISVITCIFICTICSCIDDGREVIVNKKNGILKLQWKKCCCWQGKPRIFDLNQIQKINIRLKGTIWNYDKRDKLKDYNCVIIYKNGTSEDVSNYFRNLVLTTDFENKLRKYIPVENTMPGINDNFQQGFPGYNPNILPVNNNTVPVYNPNIPPVYNYNMVNGYNSGMAQGIPQNYNQQGYTTTGNIYTNTNQNSNNQQILPKEDEINKPGTENEKYGAPGLPQ